MKLGAISVAGKDRCTGALRMHVCRAESRNCPPAGGGPSSTSPPPSSPKHTSSFRPGRISSCAADTVRLQLAALHAPAPACRLGSVHLHTAHVLPHVGGDLLSRQCLRRSWGGSKRSAVLHKYCKFPLSHFFATPENCSEEATRNRQP